MARKRSKLDLMITAIHEAGHAVAAYQLGYTPTLVTIRARGENRGCARYRRVRIHPNEDAASQRRKAASLNSCPMAQSPGKMRREPGALRGPFYFTHSLGARRTLLGLTLLASLLEQDGQRLKA